MLWLPSQTSYIEGEVVFDGRVKACELFNDIELIVIDGEG